ncbi:MAG: hypothetical protein IBX48_09900, partial [Thiomicrospira sp.]|uniref:hypothetical protein n=1 Tax=Thiomicrospira sp. TaxID=935 RepID=UPI0019EC22B0
NAFDDVLIWLSSLEIKHAAGLLSGSSEYTNGDNSDPTDQTLPDNYAGFPTAPTETELNDPNQFTQIDGTDADQTSGINDGKTEASVDDNIYITGDATQDLNLANGNDTIYIKGDLDSKLSRNQQTKKVYIEGKITDRGEINLIGNQENYVQVFQSNEGKIYIDGNGDNQVIIYGDLALGSTIQMLQGSTNSLYIGGNVQGNTGLRASVTGTIYLNKTATELGTDLNRTLDRLDATTILCRASTGSSSFIACN